jgi:FkbM family methyltransferase
MRLRGLAKYLLHTPLRYFDYFGHRVYFPRKSWVFKAACEQGVYEANVNRLLYLLARPDSVVFDVGANIGLSAIPLLTESEACRVVSFEASPTVLPFLRRTIKESTCGDRWRLFEVAITDTIGHAEFAMSPCGQDQFDGLRKTSRSSDCQEIQVATSTIDETWFSLKQPNVSVLKCDVEGAEYQVLRGASKCLRATRAAIVLEWNRDNLAAYGTHPSQLIPFAREFNYRLFSIPTFVEVSDSDCLSLVMLETENFVLIPRPSSDDRTELVR